MQGQYKVILFVALMNKFFAFPLMIALVFFYSRNIFPDVIYLKNKKFIQGLVISTDDNYLILYNYEKYLKIPLDSIESAEMGYGAILVCLEIEKKSQCNYKLHYLHKNKALVLKSNAGLELEEIPIQKITKITWNKKLPHEKPLAHFEKGFLLSIQTPKSKILGILQNFDASTELATFLDISNNESITIQTQSILSIQWESESQRVPEEKNLRNLYSFLPGYPQWQRQEYTKSILLFSGTFIPGILSYHYFQSARINASPDYQFFPIANQIYLYQKPKNLNYKQQLTLSRGLGLLAVTIYFYHLWDAGTWDAIYPKSEPSYIWQNKEILANQGIPEEIFLFPLLHFHF